MTPVQTHALAPVMDSVMDARACTEESGRLLYSSDEERACLSRHVESLPKDNPARLPMVRMVRRLMILNSDQGATLQYAAGVVEAISPAWEAARRELTVKSMRERLVPALRVIADAEDPNRREPVDPIAFVRAVRTVDEIVAVVPAYELFTASVQNALGPGRFDLLRRVADKESKA